MELAAFLGRFHDKDAKLFPESSYQTENFIKPGDTRPEFRKLVRGPYSNQPARELYRGISSITVGGQLAEPSTNTQSPLRHLTTRQNTEPENLSTFFIKFYTRWNYQSPFRSTCLKPPPQLHLKNCLSQCFSNRTVSWNFLHYFETFYSI